ncbi:MAB_1171c family putative transporter [Kitasatospora sp. NPDC093558]|uniref:MAB_1171c family putative transporter n=1 Tax=Kitasatospora sp. NPDC093558 TaxID=3155201 RepID=UPI0034325B70
MLRSAFEILIPALLWTAVVWRAPWAFRSPATRALWGTMATMALALTTRPAPVARFLEDGTGLPEVSVLIKHLLGIAAATFLLDYVFAIHGKPGTGLRSAKLRHAAAGAACVTMAVLSIFFFQHEQIGPDGIDAHYADRPVQLYLTVYYLFFFASTLLASRLFWSNRLNVPRGLLRTGVRLMAASTGTGAAYVLYRVYYIATHTVVAHDPVTGKPVPPYDPIGELLPAAAAILLVLGIAMPPLRTVSHYVRDQYAMWRLHPLWADLVAAAPQVVFGTPAGRVRNLLTLGDRSLDVAHRAFEIRDAALALRDALPPAAPGTGAPVATSGSPAVDRARAHTEAAWLHAALHHHTTGHPPATGMPPEPDHPGGATPQEEVTWLLKVATAYRHLPT